jgi:hypothetical protein
LSILLWNLLWEFTIIPYLLIIEHAFDKLIPLVLLSARKVKQPGANTNLYRMELHIKKCVQRLEVSYLKRDIVFRIALVLLLFSCVGCSNIPGQAAAQQETPPVNSPIEMQQEFPPDYSRAESIKITIYGGTATGQSFIVKRADDSMMWNREELPIDSTGTPYHPGINFTFKAPDEYLFDVLMDVMFNDWV